jgi:nitroreductase
MQQFDRDPAARQCVERVLRARRSTRAFLPEPVTLHQLRQVLALASTAPSNSNTQPWHVHAVAGEAKAALSRALEQAFDLDDAPPPAHFPEPLSQPFAGRQAEFASRYYEALGIDRADGRARAAQTRRNYSFFGAPAGLVFTIDEGLRSHSWLDLGLFVQNVMVSAGAFGLATCPQVSFARFHATIARELGIPGGEVTACGMSIGYADPQASVNQFAMPRAAVDQFLQARGFD